MTNFADRLFEAVQKTDSRLVVGLDPRFERIPETVRSAVLDGDPNPDDQGIADVYEAFGAKVIDLVAGLVPAVKIQVAFFEAHGIPGMQAYASLARRASDAGLLVIGDVKRGDIGSTAEAYASAHRGGVNVERRGPFAVDAVTVNPLFGWDGIEPFTDARKDGFGLFLLVRTSNPTAPTFQDLDTGGEPFFHRIARQVQTWATEPGMTGECGYSALGAVAGGTYAEELRRIREMMPQTPLLVPGYGAQGAGPAEIAGAFDDRGLGAIINASRSILFAHENRPGPWEDAIRAATSETTEAINKVAKGVASRGRIR